MRHILFFSLLILSSLALSEDKTPNDKIPYKCQLDQIPEGQSIDRDQAKKLVSEFDYKQNEDNKGTLHANEGVEVRVWRREGLLHLVLTQKATNFRVSTAFSESQEKFNVTMSPHIKLNCYHQNILKNNQVPNQAATLLKKEISSEDELLHFGAHVTFKVNRDLTVYWGQQNVVGRMRPIIFQDGTQYTADGPYNSKSNFCTINIESKKDYNTGIYKESIFKPMTVEKHENSESFYVVSYSFVDVQKGRKIYENPNYALLAVECNIKKDQKFTLELFNKITGKAIAIEK